MGYTLGELSSPIDIDAVTTAHGVTPPLPPAEIGHECDHCYDIYVNRGIVLDRASTAGLILSTPCGINSPVRHSGSGIWSVTCHRRTGEADITQETPHGVTETGCD